jgi:hypothetical protein
VFIDPADAEDLFPKDFIVSLPRPKGYMGAREFHDLDGPPPDAGTDPFGSNAAAFVRDVVGDDEDEVNLLRALDTFVLTGAVKLYRQVSLPPEATRRDPFRHHTMLVHSSHLVAVQAEMRDKVLRTLRGAGYEAGRGLRRLQKLFDDDLRPVSVSRAPDSPLPRTFDQLKPYLGRALSFIWEGESPVRVVNGEPGNDDPDFERQRVWKVLVGGAKLSRGYTVEGLTVSYFRRTAHAADTLMQMGRWFGFREHYGDLVRLFVGRAEGHGGTFDIYEAFEGICRDEESFRHELQRYAIPADGGEPITPMQVPPLVASHLAWVPPTARNKMFNARITFLNYGGRWSEPTLAPEDSEREKRLENEALLRELAESVTFERARLERAERGFDALLGLASPSSIEQVLERYRWADGFRSVQRELEFIRGRADADPGIDDWLLIAPQRADPPQVWEAAGQRFSVKVRSRVGMRVGVYTEPHHKSAADSVISREEVADANEALRALRAVHRGVFLFYPVIHDATRAAHDVPTMGFALLFPYNDISSTIVFGVADENRRDAPVVDARSNQPATL